MEYLQIVKKGKDIKPKREWERQNSFHKYFNTYNRYYWEMGSSSVQIPTNFISEYKIITMCIPDLNTGKILKEFCIVSYFYAKDSFILFVKMADLEKHKIY